MCLAQGPQRRDADEAQAHSLIKHSTTEPLCSLNIFYKYVVGTKKN